MLALTVALGLVVGPTTARADEKQGPTRPTWSNDRGQNDHPNHLYTGPVDPIYTAENAPEAPSLDELERVESITQYGITWTFSEPVPAGQFVTGDWYVVGPVTVTGIDPDPLFGQEVVEHPDWELVDKPRLSEVSDEHRKDRWARHGSMLNPPTDSDEGAYDSRLAHGFYNADLFDEPPIEMQPGDALVSTISAPGPLRDYRGHGQPVLAAAVLTCMDAPVPADAFRPSYVDKQNRIYLARNLRRELLHSLPLPSSAPEELSEWARAFQRPWVEHVRWGYGNAALNMPRYGREMVHNISTAALLLHLDYPAAEKEPLLIHYVQYGIDTFGFLRDEGGRDDLFRGHGGFGGGRKWALIFSGMMLDDTAMREPSKTRPEFKFAEDMQVVAGEPWSGGAVAFESHPIHVDAPTELAHPSEWDTFRSEGYRRCCTSKMWVGQALAAHMMRAVDYWGDELFFAYVDRWMTEDHLAQLEVLKKAMGDEFPGHYQRILDRGEMGDALSPPLMREMWERYRHDLPPAR
ncbi:MAG: hypothetical protein ACODAQ_00085 [Phycisphaeraceae bacterium]